MKTTKRTPYTAPPANAIADAFRVDLETAKLARRLIRGEERVTDNPLFPRTNRWISDCHNKPSRVELILSALDETLATCGVEPVWSDHDQFWPVAEYLNTGDTYSATLLFRRDTGTFRLTTWGDFYEKNEKRLALK